MYEEAFKNIDDVFWKDAGCSSELDYIEQTSWILFLKYLDDYEEDKETAAILNGETYERIIDKELTFEEAAKSFSDEKTTKNNGGVLINPTTGNTRFELTKIDPVLYTQIQRLNDNEISAPLLEQDNIGSSSYKIIKITNRFDEHVADYSKDYIKIKELALKEKQLKTIQTWMSEKIIETYISVNKDSRECNFANKWLKK